MSADASHLVLAHAKVNLSLAILAREESGFHQLETLFCALELADELEISLGAPSIRLEVSAAPESGEAPPDLGPLRDNLAWRAATLFFDTAGIRPAARIRLVKRIPAGTGLGGGSSDAAAVLNALNSLHRQPLARSRLLELAATLGSDVPFFLAGSALALAWGRGTRLLPLPPLPSAPVLLAVPQERVATADAYASLATARAGSVVNPPAIVHPGIRSWDDAALRAHNDFEAVVFPRIPLLAELRDALQGSGALIALLSGSGSAVYGIFDDSATAETARTKLAGSFADTQFIPTRTLTYHEG